MFLRNLTVDVNGHLNGGNGLLGCHDGDVVEGIGEYFSFSLK